MFQSVVDIKVVSGQMSSTEVLALIENCGFLDDIVDMFIVSSCDEFVDLRKH